MFAENGDERKPESTIMMMMTIITMCMIILCMDAVITTNGKLLTYLTKLTLRTASPLLAIS